MEDVGQAAGRQAASEPQGQRPGQRPEYRDVEVEINGRRYHYYMTADFGLLSAELRRLLCVPPRQAQWWRNPQLAQSVRQKMEELGAVYSIPGEVRILNYYKNGQAFAVWLDDLWDRARCRIVSTEYLRSVQRTMEEYKLVIERVKAFLERNDAVCGLLKELMHVTPRDILPPGFEVRKSFSEMLQEFRQRSGMTEPELYKAAGVSKAVFANIRKDENYRPSRRTAMALIYALALPPQDAVALLASAGYGLTPGDTFDMIYRNAIWHQDYDALKLDLEFVASGCKTLIGDE